MKKEIYNIILTVLAIVIILVLAFLFYIFSAKEVSLTNTNTASLQGAIKTVSSGHTKIINFTPSEILPKEIKKGNCQINSIAQPYREDAWRCEVDNSIYDPCFKTSQQNIVFCQMNPLVPSAFLIELDNSLPLPVLSPEIQENWAWFVKLKDSTYCSPFTGSRPVFGQESDLQIAYYGCFSDNKDEQVVLLEDLTLSNVWTARKAILEKDGENWIIKSIDNIDVDTVWK